MARPPAIRLTATRFSKSCIMALCASLATSFDGALAVAPDGSRLWGIAANDGVDSWSLDDQARATAWRSSATLLSGMAGFPDLAVGSTHLNRGWQRFLVCAAGPLVQALLIGVTMMALFYAKALASHVDLEVEVNGHRATAVELRRATEEAERAGSAKSEFLAKMSHELRTPLNAVIGYSQILLEDASEEGDHQSISDLNRIHDAGQHLLKIVNEILDLSKIDAGKMEIYNQPTTLHGLIAEPVAHAREFAKANENAVVVECDDTGETFACDTVKIQQAMSQILDNAVKFTRGGTISVSACRAGHDGRDNIFIKVRDTGVGIAPEQLSGLFQQFTVSNDASSTKYGGTGLGLALSRKLCLLMGGDLEVESDVGIGTCMTLRIPTASARDHSDLPALLAA